MTVERTGDSVVLNPRFNYHRHVEIVKRFMEQVAVRESAIETTEPTPDPRGDAFPDLFQQAVMDLYLYVDKNLPHVARAIGDILADDIERQIKITEDFPIRFPALNFHPFAPADQPSNWPIGKPVPYCTECESNGGPELLIHTL